MVLADRGIVCIDEFDKMSDADRVAIHEVMEQQTVTIAKAGIHASLNARCSIVAAANPIYGSYDRSLPPVKNIGLPDSLLSRFDLLFIVLDEKDPQRDSTIADHVLRMHRYCPRGQEGQPIVFADKFEEITRHDDDEEGPPMYQPKDRMLHGHFTRAEILSIPFLKKYIHYAKSRMQPKITDEASERIVTHYGSLRDKDAEAFNTLPVTARTLETMIRLSSAVAKCRLSREVTEGDVDSAFAIMEAAIFSEFTRTDDGRVDHDEGENSEMEEEEEEEDTATTSALSKRTRQSKKDDEEGETEGAEQEGEDEEGEEGAEGTAPRKRAKAAETETPATRQTQLAELMRQQFMRPDANSMTFDEITEQVNTGKDGEVFTVAEVRAVAESLEEDNKVMIDEESSTVYPIV